MSRKTKGMIFGGCVAAVLCFSLLAMLLIPRGGSRVVITVSGEQYGNYALGENRAIEIETVLGRNVVEIKDGQVRVTEADCPNQICVMSHPLSEETLLPIVCLPHELVVELQ